MNSKYLSLFCNIFLVIVLGACQLMPPNFSDISNQVKAKPIIPSEEGSYFYPVWMLNGKILCLDAPAGENYFTLIPLPDIPDLRFYDTANNIWGIIPVMPDPNCRRIEFDFLQRLPDQNLGFVESCLLYNTNEEVRAIREMDVSTGKLKTLIEPSWDIKEMGPFSFSPNMSELIQEDMADHILSNKLFYRKDGTLIQIVPNFIRAMHPSWSLIDRQIAFLGTQSYPGKKPQELKTLNDIAKLALYPWDLYISTPEGTNLKKVLSAVQDVFLVKWSPKEDA